jgi:alpha-ribazole phosphatase
MEILLIRHGETEYNITGRFSGYGDVSLNSKGMEQALSLAGMLKKEKIDRIYSSDLKRCRETGEGIEPVHPKVFSSNLREMNFGDWDGLTYDEIKSKFPGELAKWEKDWIDYAVPGGESFRVMADRVLNEFGKIIDENKSDNCRVAVITHSGCIRTILGKYITGSLENCWKFSVGHAAISRLSFADDYIYLKSLNERVYF